MSENPKLVHPKTQTAKQIDVVKKITEKQDTKTVATKLQQLEPVKIAKQKRNTLNNERALLDAFEIGALNQGPTKSTRSRKSANWAPLFNVSIQ